MAAQNSTSEIRKSVKQQAKNIVDVGRFLHANPETAFEEKLAAERLTAFLAALGYKITSPYAGIETSFRAVLAGKGKGPKVAVLAEYDALPGLGHACGHNLISTAAISAAAGMAALAGKFPGQFEIIGTPAEEGNAGKAVMVEAGAFKHLDACFMTHPADIDKITFGASANKRFTARFIGKAAHAAGAPEEGINALDAAIAFFNSVHAFRQHIHEDARIHGIITHGGTASNIIPEMAEIVVGVRSLDESHLDFIVKRVTEIVKASAKSVGAKVVMRWNERYYRSMRHVPALDSLLIDTYADEGIKLFQGTGREARASTDLANVSQVIPSAHPYFNIVPKGTKSALHTREFLKLANLPESYKKAMDTGTAMATAAYRLLSDKKTLDAVKRDFKASGK